MVMLILMWSAYAGGVEIRGESIGVSRARDGSVTVSLGEDGVVSLSGGVRRSSLGSVVNFDAGATADDIMGGGSVNVRNGSLSATSGAAALSGGAASTGAATGGDTSLDGGASVAGVGGNVDIFFGTGLLGSDSLSVVSGSSASGGASIASMIRR
ncbi:hypothetical protein PInf_007990 [Phytophthora infestans]|nr:hypothetical protein PInf_007990 [Phytophthora infestans]